MAAPQVSGAAALILSVAPSLTVDAAEEADILEHVDRLPLARRRTWGRNRRASSTSARRCRAAKTKSKTRPLSKRNRPMITGTAQAGKTLTASAGEWSEEPIAYSYQWKRCNGRGEEASCSTISGATNQTYTLARQMWARRCASWSSPRTSKGSSKPASSEHADGACQAGRTRLAARRASAGPPKALSAERKRVNPLHAGHRPSRSRGSRSTCSRRGTSGQELFEGVVYAEASGAPGCPARHDRAPDVQKHERRRLV